MSKSCPPSALFGSTGVDFEGGIIALSKFKPNCFGGRWKKKGKFLLFLKSGFIFLYSDDASNQSAPVKCISLLQATTTKSSPLSLTINDSLSTPLYNITFPEAPKRDAFRTVVLKQIQLSNADDKKRDLGHKTVLDRRESMKMVRAVAENVILTEAEEDDIEDKELAGVLGGYGDNRTGWGVAYGPAN